jgi:hypothetical protein
VGPDHNRGVSRGESLGPLCGPGVGRAPLTCWLKRAEPAMAAWLAVRATRLVAFLILGSYSRDRGIRRAI